MRIKRGLLAVLCAASIVAGLAPQHVAADTPPPPQYPANDAWYGTATMHEVSFTDAENFFTSDMSINLYGFEKPITAAIDYSGQTSTHFVETIVVAGVPVPHSCTVTHYFSASGPADPTTPFTVSKPLPPSWSYEVGPMNVSFTTHNTYDSTCVTIPAGDPETTPDGRLYFGSQICATDSPTADPDWTELKDKDACGNDGVTQASTWDVYLNPGTVVVKKTTDPAGASTNFPFTGAVAGSIADGGSLSAKVAPGAYTVTEGETAGWTLSELNCDDVNSSGDVALMRATFQVEPNETVTCTFTNKLEGGGGGGCPSPVTTSVDVKSFLNLGVVEDHYATTGHDVISCVDKGVIKVVNPLPAFYDEDGSTVLDALDLLLTVSVHHKTPAAPTVTGDASHQIVTYTENFDACASTLAYLGALGSEGTNIANKSIKAGVVAIDRDPAAYDKWVQKQTADTLRILKKSKILRAFPDYQLEDAIHQFAIPLAKFAIESYVANVLFGTAIDQQVCFDAIRYYVTFDVFADGVVIPNIRIDPTTGGAWEFELVDRDS